ncbi:MAG: protein translocase subunit SecF [Spirochaetaceae bacterium]|nr:protein translocase subunit SecF [Spirochaetaceae bacterium]
MSEKIIYFSKIRTPGVILAFLLIFVGIGGTIYYGGFNLGIDFSSGISMRAQIAESVLKISYTGKDRVIVNVKENLLQVTTIGNGGLNREEKTFVLSDYPAVSNLASELSAIEGITVEETGDNRLSALSIIGLNYATELSENDVILNCANANQDKYIDIADIRSTLSELGSIKIQTVGRASNQEFIIGMQNSDNSDDFSAKASSAIIEILGKKYGPANIVIKQTDYVGPQFSQSLGGHALMLVSLTLIFILIYIWFRFKLPYAISSVASLVYVAIFMVGFVGVFQLEVNTATIAAILTVVGYALNDSIVIFDRIRENQGLLREKNFSRIVDISVTKSLGRTIITSFSTIIAVAAIYIFASGMIKIFAFNIIIGIIVGTFSSIFVGSGVLIWLMNIINKRGKFYDLEKKSDDKPRIPSGSDAKQLPAESEVDEDKDKPQATQTAQATQSNVRWQPKRKRKK